MIKSAYGITATSPTKEKSVARKTISPFKSYMNKIGNVRSRETLKQSVIAPSKQISLVGVKPHEVSKKELI